MMKGNKKNKSANNDTLPPTSYPSAEDETTFPVPPPQIEGYKILGELGKAGQGRVWRALQLSTQREVALKVPRAGLLHSERSRARFEREVEVASRLKHPNIARIYDSGIHQDRYYYTMELIEGIQLNECVEQHNLTQRQILELMRTVCQAVQHAHQNAVIHRDIKPSNILVTEDGQPHIVDFGLAKYIPGEDLSKAISIDGEMVGTPAYMSPEQALGEMEKVDTRTDVYSLGVILFVLLTGKNPHDLSGSRSKVLQRIAQEEIRRPRKINPKIDKELEALLLKSLDNDPDKRYAFAGELAGDIDNYLNGRPLMAKAPTVCYLLCKQISKRHQPILIMCLMFVAFAIGLSISLFLQQEKERKYDARVISDFDRSEHKKIIEQSAFSQKPILSLKFRVYPSDKRRRMFDLFNPVIETIRKKLEKRVQQPVYIDFDVTESYDEAIKALVKSEVDFVRFGPASYIIAKNRNPSIRLLAMETDARARTGKEFYGMIVVRKDSNVKDISDLRNCSFAFGDRNSTIGRYIVQFILHKAGIHAHNLKKYDYMGSHAAVMEALLEGKFEGGAVKESTYKSYKDTYEKKGLEFPLEVLVKFTNVTKPWIARQDLDEDIFLALQDVLLSIKEPEGLKEIKVSGFTYSKDKDYDLIRESMEKSKEFFPWWYIFVRYWPASTTTLIIVIGTLVYALMVLRKRRRAVSV